MDYAYCVNKTSICDGITHCQHGEDETQCITECPDGCQCQNESMIFTCNVSSLPNIPKKVHGLDLSNNDLDIMAIESKWPFLIYLNIARCGIKDMGIFHEEKFPILRILDVEYNEIECILALNLPALEELYLRGNPLTKISIRNQMRILSLTRTQLKYLRLNDNIILSSVLSLDASYNNIRAIETVQKVGRSAMLFLNLSHNFLRDIDGFCYRCTNLLRLDLSYNEIEQLSLKSFSGISSLRYLSLRGNKVTELKTESLLNVHAVEELDIGQNVISVIDYDAFDGLQQMTILKLDHNRLDQLRERLFRHTKSLYILSVSNNRITTVSPELLINLKSLGELNMSGNQIHFPKRKLFVHQYPLQILDIRNNLINPAEDIFFGLSGLQKLYVDSFSLCCIRPVHLTDEQCISDNSIIPSCWELINLGVLKVFVWYAAVACLYTNGLAIRYRYKRKTIASSMHNILITQLSVIDMFPAVYLMIIGTYDKYSQEWYSYLDHIWRDSGLCTFAGVMVTWSNVASAWFILAIALEGLLTSIWPDLKKKGYKVTVVCSVTIWMISFIAAVIPGIPDVTFPKHLYSSNGFCLPLPLTKYMFTNTDWEYSFRLLVVLKILIYALTCLALLMTYCASRRIQSGDTAYDKRRQGKTAIRAIAVILTCGLCWIPTAVLGETWALYK